MKKNFFYLRSSAYAKLLALICLCLGGLFTYLVYQLSVAASSTFYILIWSLLILTFILLYVFPLNYFLVRKVGKGWLELESFILLRSGGAKRVKLVHYWWNYTPIKDYQQVGGDEADANYSKNQGTGNRDGSGVPTNISLQVKLRDEQAQIIILEERKGNWASIPPWTYGLERCSSATACIPCTGLKKMMEWYKGG
ncbi:MAG: hypothetical protein AAFR36_11290 [Bacteroidota bacterium]